MHHHALFVFLDEETIKQCLNLALWQVHINGTSSDRACLWQDCL